MAMLEVQDIQTYYGNIQALKGVSLTVDEGEVVTLIGSNGAGKSTTLRSISGLDAAARRLDQVRRARRSRACPPQDIVALGISHSPEGRHCFPRMTVRENLDMGAYLPPRHDIEDDLERVFVLFPRLQERERQKAGTMSGGEQQMLAIGRALMARPKLLLLDEPSMGIAPILVDRIYETIARDQQQGTRSCSSSRTPTTRSTPPPAATCSRPAAGRARTSRRSCATTPRSRGPTWATDGSRPDRCRGTVPVFLWLVSAGRGMDRRRKGYSERAGLAAGLLLSGSGS